LRRALHKSVERLPVERRVVREIAAAAGDNEKITAEFRAAETLGDDIIVL